MITIRLNNQSITLENYHSLNDILLLHGYTKTHFAVAVNQIFIPKIQYMDYIIKAGDHIEIITPMQGG